MPAPKPLHETVPEDLPENNGGSYQDHDVVDDDDSVLHLQNEGELIFQLLDVSLSLSLSTNSSSLHPDLIRSCFDSSVSPDSDRSASSDGLQNVEYVLSPLLLYVTCFYDSPCIDA